MIAASVVLYLVPFVLALLARGAQKPKTWELALDVPMVFAVDLLGILALTFVVPLDWAIVASRPIWLAGGFALARRGRLAWPRCLDFRATALVAMGALVAVRVSLLLSRPWAIWDRRWHMPLVSSIEGQRIPFQNVYEPGSAFHYHFSGDVHAAVLRALSLDQMSSGLALSLSHDVIFALIGTVLALLFVGRGRPAMWLVLFAIGAVLLHGPVVQKDAGGWDFRAHMYQAFLTDSFRPHIAVGALILLGMIAAVCVRATEGSPDGRRIAAVTLPGAALLSITDETSFCIVIASLGVAWVVDGKLLADRRALGLALLASMVACGAVVNLALRASLAPGGPVQHLGWVPARVGDLSHGTIPIRGEHALAELVYDLLPLLVPTAGVVFHAVTRGSRRLVALAMAPCAATVLSAVLAMKIQVNAVDGLEVQRFFVAVFFVVLVVALWLLPGMPRWSAAAGLVTVGSAVPVFFTGFWFRDRAPEILRGSEATQPLLAADLYEIDCRRAAGAHLGEPPVVTYVDEPLWYFYTSCRGVFEAGLSDPPWSTKIRPAFETPQHLAEFIKMVPPDATVPAVCAAAPGPNDRVCEALTRGGGCVPAGDDFVTCRLTPDERRRLTNGG
jgi:hypothetical protein